MFIPDADGHLSIRITRASRGQAPASAHLTPTDWQRAVDGDSSLQLIDHVLGVDPQTHEPMLIASPHAARWLAHPDLVPYVFYFRAGEIVLHSGDRHAARKAQELASLLGAAVVIDVD